MPAKAFCRAMTHIKSSTPHHDAFFFSLGGACLGGKEVCPSDTMETVNTAVSRQLPSNRGGISASVRLLLIYQTLEKAR